MKAKKFVKKIVALAGSAAMLGATVGGAMAALNDLPSPFVNSNGVFDAYVVVGANAGIPDVVSAIELTAAFAQKASLSEEGQAVLGTKAWEGANATVTIGHTTADDDIVLTGDNVTAFAPYTWTVGSTEYNATQEFKIDKTKVNMSGDMAVYFLPQAFKLTFDNTNTTGLMKGQFIKIGEVPYKILELKESGGSSANVTIGRLDENAVIKVGESRTYGDITLEVLEVVYGIVSVRLTGDPDEGEVVEALEKGDVLNYGNLEITVDKIVPLSGNEYAQFDVVYSRETLKSGEYFNFDDRYKVDFTDNANPGDDIIADLYIYNENATMLTSGQSITGPMDLFNITYIGVENSGSYTNVTLAESAPIYNDVTCTSNTSHTILNLTDGTQILMPGITYQKSDNFGRPWQTFSGSQVTFSGKPSTIYVRAMSGDSVDYYIECTGDGSGGGDLVFYDHTGSSYSQNATTPSGIFIDVDHDKLSAQAVWITKSGTSLYGRKDMNFLVDTSGNKWTYYELNSTNEPYARISWASNKITITYPDNSKLETTILWDEDNQKSLLNESYIGLKDGETDSFGTRAYWFNGTGARVSDDSVVNVTFEIPVKRASYGTGGWGTATYTLSVGDSQSFESATTITLESVSGGVNYVSPGFAVLDNELSTVDKPVILVGGPAINSLVQQLGNKTLTLDEWRSGNYTDKAIIDLIEDAFDGNAALVVAGYEADDTRIAARLLAKELLFGGTVLGQNWSGKDRIVLDTSGATVSDYTSATVVE